MFACRVYSVYVLLFCQSFTIRSEVFWLVHRCVLHTSCGWTCGGLNAKRTAKCRRTPFARHTNNVHVNHRGQRSDALLLLYIFIARRRMPTRQSLLLCCTCNSRSGIVFITQGKAGGAAVVVSAACALQAWRACVGFFRAMIYTYVRVLPWSQRVAFDRLHSATQAAKRKSRSVEPAQRNNHQEESPSCSCSDLQTCGTRFACSRARYHSR